jgi:hypothetical protein
MFIPRAFKHLSWMFEIVFVRMFSERMLTYSLTMGGLAIMANSAPD